MNILKHLWIVLFSVLSINVLGNEIDKQIKDNFKKSKPVEFSVFKEKSNKLNRSSLKDHKLLTLDKVKCDKIIKNRPKNLILNVPSSGTNPFKLELTQVEIFTPDFKVSTSSGKNIEFKEGIFYRGVIRGDTNSIVTVSISSNEISGIISGSSGNYDLGKLEGSADYIINKSSELPTPFECSVSEERIQQDNTPQNLLQTDCKTLRVYIECDFDLYTKRGSSITNVTTFVTGLFSQVATLYANEGIPIQLSQIFIWTTQDPFVSQTTSSSVLTSFRQTRTTFNGDLAHLISTRSANQGGVAYLDVLCSSSFRYAYSNIYNSYQTAPAYSWSVNVFAHEMGHNMGSPHTQSCSWVGGALDNCYTTEGGCPPGPAPVNGGTIMSYCHLTANGVNFANGFGQQPGDRIRSRFNNATCIGTSPISISPSSATICTGQSVTLSATGAINYTWTPQTGLNTTTGSSVVANPTTTTTYTVSSTSNGCTSTKTIQVTVLPQVNFGTLQNVSNVYAVSGDPSPIVFSTPPSGAGGQFAYQWYFKNGINSAPTGQSTTGWISISGATSNSYDPPIQSQPITFAVQVDPIGTQDCAPPTWSSGIRQVTITSVPQYSPGILSSGNQGFCSGGGNPNNIVFSQNPSGGGVSSSTNLITSPEVLTTPYWTFENLTVTQNIENSPFGSLSAERLMETATNGLHRFYSPIIATSGTITSSIYVKPNGRTSVGLFVGDFNSMAQVTFSLVGTGSVVSQTANVISRSITQEVNGWYRISVTSTGNANYRFRLNLLNSSNAQTYTGVTTSGVFVFGAKLESGQLTPYTGTTQFSYQWYSRTGIFDTPVDGSTTGWTLISGATAQNYDPPVITQSTSYACRVILVNGSQWAAGVRKVTVLPAFTPGVVTSADETFCDPVNPSNIVLSQNPVGSGAFQFAWYYKIGTTSVCPTGGSTTGWSSLAVSGTSLNGSGISYDPPLGTMLGTGGRTYAVLITPISNGTLPACGVPTWSSGCRKVSVVDCGFAPPPKDTTCSIFELGDPRPNPSQNTCSIDITIPEGQKAQFRIIDINASVVFSIDVSQTQTLIVDVSKFTNGIYSYSLNSENTRLSNKLIVLK